MIDWGVKLLCMTSCWKKRWKCEFVSVWTDWDTEDSTLTLHPRWNAATAHWFPSLLMTKHQASEAESEELPSWCLVRGGSPDWLQKQQKYHLKNLNDKNHRCVQIVSKFYNPWNMDVVHLYHMHTKKKKIFFSPLVASIHADSFGWIFEHVFLVTEQCQQFSLVTMTTSFVNSFVKWKLLMMFVDYTIY